MYKKIVSVISLVFVIFSYSNFSVASDSSNVSVYSGLPSQVHVATSKLTDGDHQIAVDSDTGNTLFVSTFASEISGLFTKNSAGKIYPFKKVSTSEQSSQCNTIHCPNNRAPVCFHADPGGCVCLCGSYFQLAK